MTHLSAWKSIFLRLLFPYGLGIFLILIVLFIFINYPPDLSPPYMVVTGNTQASLLTGPIEEPLIGNFGKLPPHLMPPPPEVVPEIKVEIKIKGPPAYNIYLYGFLMIIPMSLGYMFFSPVPA